MMRIAFLLVLLFCLPALGRSADVGAAVQHPVGLAFAPPDTVLVADIILLGHKRTRSSVIFREMTFGKGARIPTGQLEEEMAATYSALMNTGLFASLEISYADTLLGPGRLTVTLNIRETWYLYPVPVFSLADRNFNFWWRDQNRSLDRVNVGAKLTYYNFSGRRDRLKLGYTTGYTEQYEAAYRLPYLNRQGNLGVEFRFNFLRRREQNYATADNQQLFYRDPDNFVYRRTDLDLSFTYRRKLYVSHRLQMGYRDSGIADTIARVLNPAFFGNGSGSLEFFRLEYRYINDRRDVRNYPWKGYYLETSLVKEGLGITGERSGLTGGVNFSKFWPLSEKLALNAGLATKYSFIRSQQPFLENRAIGFENNSLVGYQFYVVDGLDMAIWRVGLRRQLLKGKTDLGKLVFIDAFRYIPYRILFALQLNQGYANAPFIEASNQLNNRLLTGGSVGLDLVLFYDMVGSIQYNRNHLGEDGIFLALNLNF
ncbi:BamA/TamA family outer membrane protein [Neolewinella lacunae]|uniref:BamA/TamA family outer membrane protein n=1 Tax=Neolewinella lacunae TaxID=1517758 RepID=A0A923PQS5_9BACT|nr:BamA/TamA family outer membrane protein [Neolewinella lacunae]MBC6996830.1 BamA/TamA family outer membrane protein [Neolewinella lacunae]MDN3633808.1 BamA/TamA family outer membrane protein [Neolewinella lacunae]